MINRYKIGVDAVPLQKLNGGISYYLFYLLDELIQLRPADTFFLFADREAPDLQYFKQYRNVKICLYSNYLLGHRIWTQTFLALACFMEKIDLFWGPTQSIPLLKRPSMKTILTLHDFVYRLCPETTPLVTRLHFLLLSRLMLKQANKIIAVSKGTAAKLIQFYSLQSHEVISPPLKKLTPLPSENKQYLITVGTLEPRKNLIKLLQTYIHVLKTTPPEQILPLLIVGGGGWKNGLLLKLLQEAKATHPHHVQVLGFVPDETLGTLLSNARYCIMMSKYEGYGMPLAEARACQTAIICTDLEEMREAAENDGIFLSPDKWETQIRTYFLSSTPMTPPKLPTYGSNKSKAIKISKLIDELCNATNRT